MNTHSKQGISLINILYPRNMASGQQVSKGGWHGSVSSSPESNLLHGIKKYVIINE